MVHSKLHLLPVEQTQLDLLNHNISHPVSFRTQTLSARWLSKPPNTSVHVRFCECQVFRQPLPSSFPVVPHRFQHQI